MTTCINVFASSTTTSSGVTDSIAEATATLVEDGTGVPIPTPAGAVPAYPQLSADMIAAPGTIH